MKLISRVVAASLGLIRPGIVITRRDSTHRVCGCSPCLLTFAVTYPVIIQYRTKTTSCQSFNWLSTWNLWARTWRKIVHHQGILTGWKPKTPLQPGAWPWHHLTQPIHQTINLRTLFPCSSAAVRCWMQLLPVPISCQLNSHSVSHAALMAGAAG